MSDTVGMCLFLMMLSAIAGYCFGRADAMRRDK